MKYEWISIKDAIPVLKKNQHCILVLVCTWDEGLEDQDWYEGDVQTAMYFFKSGFKGWLLNPENPLDDWKEAYDGTFRYDFLPDKVTHWMHLHKPPIRNEKNAE